MANRSRPSQIWNFRVLDLTSSHNDTRVSARTNLIIAQALRTMTPFLEDPGDGDDDAVDLLPNPTPDHSTATDTEAQNSALDPPLQYPDLTKPSDVQATHSATAPLDQSSVMVPINSLTNSINPAAKRHEVPRSSAPPDLLTEAKMPEQTSTLGPSILVKRKSSASPSPPEDAKKLKLSSEQDNAMLTATPPAASVGAVTAPVAVMTMAQATSTEAPVGLKPEAVVAVQETREEMDSLFVLDESSSKDVSTKCEEDVGALKKEVDVSS